MFKSKSVITMIFMLMMGMVLSAQSAAHKWALPPSAKQGVIRSVFATQSEAEAAYANGSFTYYEPKFLGHATLKPADGKTTKVFMLERDSVVEMLVFGGKYAWVVLKEGTKCRYNLYPDGTPFATPYALDECGNPIRAIAYPGPRLTPTAQPAPVAAQTPSAAPIVVQAPAPEVRVIPAPPVVVQTPAPKVVVEQPAPAPVYGPAQGRMILPPPAPRYYDQKLNFPTDPQPAIPEVKKIHWGWKVAGAVILGAIVWKALDHKKAPDQQRAVVTDPPSAGPNGGLAFQW